MHAPKPLTAAPLHFHTHLCNNVEPVLQQVERFPRGLDALATFAAAVEPVFVAHQRGVAQLHEKLAVAPYEAVFAPCPSIFAALSRLTEMVANHAATLTPFSQSFTQHLQQDLQPATEGITASTMQAHASMTALLKKREEKIAAVQAAKQKYWQKGSAAVATQEKYGRESSKSQSAGREMKDAASAYAEVVNALLQFFPAYDKEGGQILQMCEANFRFVLSTVQLALEHWASEFERMVSDLNKGLAAFRTAVNTISIDDDLRNVVATNYHDPDPDPSQVWSFQLFDGVAASTPVPLASPRAASPPPSAGFLGRARRGTTRLMSHFRGKDGTDSPMASPAGLVSPKVSDLESGELEDFFADALRSVLSYCADTTLQIESLEDGECTASTKGHLAKCGKRILPGCRFCLGHTCPVCQRIKSSQAPTCKNPPCLYQLLPQLVGEDLLTQLHGHSGRVALGVALQRQISECNSISPRCFEIFRALVSRALDDSHEGTDVQAAALLLSVSLHFTKNDPTEIHTPCSAETIDSLLELQPEATSTPLISNVPVSIDTLSLAYALRNHPFCITLVLWEEWFWSFLVGEKDDEDVLALPWGGAQAALAHVQAHGHGAVCTQLATFIRRMQRIGVDLRVQKQLVARVFMLCRLSRAQFEQLCSELPNASVLLALRDSDLLPPESPKH